MTGFLLYSDFGLGSSKLSKALVLLVGFFLNISLLSLSQSH